MAITVDQAFITQFGAEVKAAYSLESRLFGEVRKRDGVVGSVSRFQKLGNVAAYQKVRNADLTILEPAHTYVDVTLADWYASELVDKLDLLKSNVDIKMEYVKNVARALAKKQDEIILAAILAGAAASTTNTGAYSVARMLETKKLFDNAMVPASGRKMILSASAMEDLLATTQITSSDYNSVKSLVQGDLTSFIGFKIIQVPDAYLSGTTDKVQLAFHEDAVGCAVGAGIETMIEWSPDKHAHWIKATLSMGAGVIDTTGVSKFGVTV